MYQLRAIPLILLIVACARFDPIGNAETLEQKAFATYGTFVIAEETAAELMGSPNVPDTVKVTIQTMDGIAKPAADILLDVALEVAQARAALQLNPDASLVDKLNVAVGALDAAYRDAKPKIDALQSVVANLN